MPPLGVRAARALISFVARVAPGWRAADWKAEWHAEIEWYSRNPLTPWQQLNLLRRCLGAAPHVLWLWRHHWSLDMLTQDVKYALRTLVRRPAFTITAVLTLALGIGANTAIFSLVDRLLLRPLPYHEADRLVAIWSEQQTVSKRMFHDLREPFRLKAEATGSAFADVAVYSNWTYTLTGTGEAERLRAAGVSANFFDVLGVPAAHGRTFAPGEDSPGRDRVVVLGHRFWKRAFGGDPAVIGRTITLSTTPVTVVGIMPPSFEFPRATTDLWRPLAWNPADARDYTSNYLTLLGRLAPGMSVQHAHDAMQRFVARVATVDPNWRGDWTADLKVTALREDLVGDSATTLRLLFAAVGCILLIASANIANLLLARGASRRREMAIRSAVGAGRLRIVRQLLVEAVVLACAGAAVGLLFARWSIVALAANLPSELPGLAGPGLDLRVLAFSIAVAFATGILFGLLPAVHASRVELRSAVDDGPRGSADGGGRRARRVLVVAEIALAVALVATGGLLVRSLLNVLHVGSGFDPEGVLTLRVSANRTNDDEIRVFHQQLFEKVRAVPGVSSVGAIHILPMSVGNWNPSLNVEGRAEEPARRAVVNWRAANAGYFETMKIPLLRGRLFAASDRGGEPVALINDAVARQVFKDENPIGRRVNTFFEGEGVWARIVGVVGDVRQHGLEEDVRPELYRPLEQVPIGTVALVVETSMNPEVLVPPIRRTVAEISVNAPVWDVAPMTDVVAGSTKQRRFVAGLLASFAVLALVLGAIGIFGVMSYDVAQQTREIGVRLALGAEPSFVRRRVFADGFKLTAVGLVLGLAGAVAASRAVTTSLVGVTRTDPTTLAAVVVLLGAVSLLAVWIPARRASRVDPVTALRG